MPQSAEALQEALAAGVVAVVAVGMDYDSNSQVLELATRHKGVVHAALGLHPWQLAGKVRADVERILRQIEDNLGRAVAVGEVGLDYDKHVLAGASREQQQSILRDVLTIAARHGKPVSVHSRYAWRDALDSVGRSGVRAAAFHWYTGPSSVLAGILRGGYTVSITPAVEYHAEHRRMARQAPAGNLMLETDCPVRYGLETKYASAPKDVQRALAAAANIKRMDVAVLAEQTTQNALRFFGVEFP